jgi:hypothetical protein
MYDQLAEGGYQALVPVLPGVTSVGSSKTVRKSHRSHARRSDRLSRSSRSWSDELPNLQISNCSKTKTIFRCNKHHCGSYAVRSRVPGTPLPSWHSHSPHFFPAAAPRSDLCDWRHAGYTGKTAHNAVAGQRTLLGLILVVTSFRREGYGE